ncbi:MAG: hypothetical protein AB1295_06560 [Candidatus Micrarchaeota archaeon]
MNVNVLASTDNKLLDRKEIEAEVGFDGATPKRSELKAAVCQKLALSPDMTVLRKVQSSFGRKTVTVTAFSYSSKEALAATEPGYVKKREGMQEEQKAPAAPSDKKA